MPGAPCSSRWTIRVHLTLPRPIPQVPDAGRVAALFGIHDGHCETLYDRFALEICAGQIIAVIGPSGAGKTMLLREAARAARGARWLRTDALGRCATPAVAVLSGGTLSQRLAMLSRCGLAEAAALITPARLLSGGQRYRLALAEALFAAQHRPRGTLVVADEFGATLDRGTAVNLCRQVRRLIRGSRCSLLLATPRQDLVGALQPDRVIVKPLREPARWVSASDRAFRRPTVGNPRRWRIERGTIKDYKALASFHYLAGPPAAHKRVYVIRVPAHCADLGGPDVAAVLVVSPPVFNVRGRNLATNGRYSGADRRSALALLNAEIECISRVIVHPVYRGCRLAVRLVRRAIHAAETPLVEALAAMGTVHPFFEKAGMTAYPVGLDVHLARLVSAADTVGLTPEQLAAVEPVRSFLDTAAPPAARFLTKEIDLCIARTLCSKRLSRLADPLAEVCRRTGRHYVYYLAPGRKEKQRWQPNRHGSPPPRCSRCTT